MSHISKIFEEAPIQVQNRNGFDLSHTHSGSSKTGQLVPVLTKLIAPNSTISLGVQAEVSLPPLVAPFYGKIDFAIEGFIVPCSILYGGWKQFITNNDASNFPANQASVLLTDATQPTVTAGWPADGFGKDGYKLPYFLVKDVLNGTLSDWTTADTANENVYTYMGANLTFSGSTTYTTKISLLPALAYHKICDVFYRNTKLTNTWFSVNPNVGYTLNGNTGTVGSLFNNKNVSLVWHSFYTETDVANTAVTAGAAGYASSSAKFGSNAELKFPDTVSLFSTRQRPWKRDYFTSAVASPQQGGASTLKFSVDVSTAGSEFGTFTINALRMANSLQSWLEKNNLSGEYADMMRNRWGVRPIDADFDEPHYLGRVVIPVYQHTLGQSTYHDTSSLSATGNPYVTAGIQGAKTASGQADGEGSICDNFNVSCWSYLMCIASLYPHANYNYGLNRELTMTNLGDFPAPELQSVGMEEIKNYEICGSVITAPATYEGTFGYIPRYSRFKYVDDHCSGELRPGKTLSSFQIQRDITGVPSLGTNFVTIQPNALDNVLSVNTATSNLSCWWEIYFKLHVVMPLADFCIPTLGELQDTHTIKTTVGGARLS